MSGVRTTLRAYVDLSRLANTPTCVTNVLTGCAIATVSVMGAVPRVGGVPGVGGVWGVGRIEPLRAAAVTVAVLLMYVAGMALNDVVDHAWDSRFRPERPIPSGRISRRGAFCCAAICLVLGLAILGVLSMEALAAGVVLAACIVGYDLLHHRTALSVVLMGLCRGLVYPLTALAVAGVVDARVAGWLGGALAIYIAVVTFLARRESEGDVGSWRWLSIVLPLIVLAPAAVVRPQEWLWTILAAAALIAWLLRAVLFVLQEKPRISRAVGLWLSGICLVDCLYLTLLDQPATAALAVGCFALTAFAQRYVPAT